MNPNNVQSLSVPGDGEIREILAQRIDRHKQSVGIVAGIVEPTGRRIVAYGSLAKDDPRTLDGDTVFEIGSITKVFTSLVLADMANRGEVALDDPAAKYLPGHVIMPEWGGHPITLLHLATHTSGLPRVPGNLKPKDARNPYENYAVDDLYAFLSNYTLTRDPGSQVEYSNLGGGLLGHVLANRAGTNYESPDYESLIRARITQPLGMLDTGIALSTGMQQRMTTGHNALLEPVANWDFGALAGAGALRSSANDMLTFLEAFLGYRESPLAAAMKSMLEVRRSVPNTKFEVALGWHMLENRAWHDGGTGGFCSFAGFDRHARTGVVVLSNAFALPGIADIGVHLLNPNAPLADLDPGVPVDPQLLDNYTGRYRLAPNRVIEIGRDGGRLFAQVTAEVEGQPVAGPKLGVSARNENSFVVKMTGSQITFEIGTDGRATGLMMHRAGREPTPAPRLS